MSIEKCEGIFPAVRNGRPGLGKEHSSATVEEAAEALGCEPQRIAKTLSFQAGDRVVLVVTAGDRKIDNKKYREQFGCKAKCSNLKKWKTWWDMQWAVSAHLLSRRVEVYLDESLKRFETVFPAAGSNSMIELSIEELERYSLSLQWVDVCKES